MYSLQYIQLKTVECSALFNVQYSTGKTEHSTICIVPSTDDCYLVSTVHCSLYATLVHCSKVQRAVHCCTLFAGGNALLYTSLQSQLQLVTKAGAPSPHAGGEADTAPRGGRGGR